VRARIRQIEAYSAHADRAELVDWVAARMPVHAAILVTHGEPESAARLQAALRERLAKPPPILAPPLDSYLVLDRAIPQLVQDEARLPSEPSGRRDWHNDYASFLLDLSERLRNAPDEAMHLRLLGRLTDALQ
jgi:metallo-beta-lactamase family protein